MPEYTIEEIEDETNFIKSWFSYTQCNSNEHRAIVQIKCNNTVLYGCGIITLDGGRYTTSYPEECLLGKMVDKIGSEISFNYYIRNSLKYCLYKYYLNKLSYCFNSSHIDFIENILIFNNEKEFKEFCQWIEKNIEEIKIKISEIKEVYHLEVDKKEYVEYVKNRIKCSQVLQKELLSFKMKNK